MSRNGFLAVVVGCALTLGLLVEMPQWLYRMHPLSLGFPVELNSDEDLYLSRVTEALEGRANLAAEGITGDPEILPLQSALIEEWEGRLFSWTGLSASELFQVMDFVAPFLVFLLLVTFFLQAGFSRWAALSGAIIFSLLELYNLNRPIHQRESFLLTLGAIVLLVEGVSGRRLLGVLGGALLGLLVGVYFWSWTFAWTWAGILFLWVSIQWAWDRRHTHLSLPQRFLLFFGRSRPPFLLVDWQWLLLFLVLGVLTAVPFIIDLLEGMAHPLMSAVQPRLEFIPSRAPESWIRTSLFTLQLVGLVGAFARSQPLRKKYQLVLVTLLAAYIVFHQQVVHGVTFLFSSHYLFALVLAGGVTFLVSILHMRESKWLFLSFAGSALFLGGIAYDARYVINHFRIDEGRYTEQHLASILPELHAMQRTTILSDIDTMKFVASHTKHDVPYSPRLNYMLITDEELAERYCLSKVPLPPQTWDIEGETVLLYDPDVTKLDPAKRAYEIELVQETCKQMSIDPVPVLERYGVEYILWDARRQQLWNVKRFKARLGEVKRDTEWILYKIL